MANYRAIYRKHYGQIPMTFDIHHIDGNHKNDRPENLVAVPEIVHRNYHQAQDRLRPYMDKTLRDLTAKNMVKIMQILQKYTELQDQIDYWIKKR